MPCMDFHTPVMDSYPVCVVTTFSKQAAVRLLKDMNVLLNKDKRTTLKWLFDFCSGSPALPSPWQELCSHVLTSLMGL